MITICLILFLLFSQMLSDPTYVEELQDLLNSKVDILDLEALKYDDEMTRWNKMRKIHFMLMKKPKEIRSQFKTRMRIRQSMHDEFIESRLSRTDDPVIKDFWNQINSLDANWSISEGEAAEQEFQLLAKLTPQQRRSLGNIWRC
ncbi:hypothetical protein RB195_025971 [Necator americanus]|uniref:Uncharacterized protein n=2 Tax=Necator americanus TaxID=51031 RepID=A0ABR1EUX9_NECAM